MFFRTLKCWFPLHFNFAFIWLVGLIQPIVIHSNKMKHKRPNDSFWQYKGYKQNNAFFKSLSYHCLCQLRGHLNCKNRWGLAFWGNRGGGQKFWKKNFIITIRYEIPTFLSVGPFFEEGGRGSRKFRPEAEILGIFFNWGGP